MISGSIKVERGDYKGGGRASAEIKRILNQMGTSSEIIKKAMIAIFEAEMNIIIHSYGGEIVYRLDEEKLEVEAVDTGPGISDVVLAMKEGYSTAPSEARELGYGAGMGLPNIRKNTDFFCITTSPKGTVLKFHIKLTLQEGFEEIPIKVVYESEKCKLCLDCVKECPTKAIRLRNEGVTILSHRCVNCNRCVEVCPTGVFDFLLDYTQLDLREFLGNFTRVVVPTPIASKLHLEGKWIPWINFMKKEYGIDVISLIPWERALTEAIENYINGIEIRRLPVVATVCPSVIQWIQTEYPSLLDNVAPYLFPFVTSIDYFAKDGKVLYVPICPSQIVTVDLLYKNSANIGLLHPRKLFDFIREIKSDPTRNQVGNIHFENKIDRRHNYIISGVIPVKKFLDKLEKGKVGKELKFVELYACYGGCYGFPFTDAEPNYLRWFSCRSEILSIDEVDNVNSLFRASSLKPRKGVRLALSMKDSLEKLSLIQSVSERLPGRDCGVCGAPKCLDFAEEVVIYNANISRCPYTLKNGKEI